MKGLLKMFWTAAWTAVATATGTIAGFALVGWVLTMVGEGGVIKGTRTFLNALNKTPQEA